MKVDAMLLLVEKYLKVLLEVMLFIAVKPVFSKQPKKEQKLLVYSRHLLNTGFVLKCFF